MCLRSGDPRHIQAMITWTSMDRGSGNSPETKRETVMEDFPPKRLKRNLIGKGE